MGPRARGGAARKTEKLKSCEPGNRGGGAGFQVPRFPPRRPSHASRRAAAVRLHCPRHGGRRVNDTPAEREDQSIWTRLRRRKVVQWSVAYVAAAWALLQGLEFLAGTYDWPRHVSARRHPRVAARPADRPGPGVVPRRPRRAAYPRHRADHRCSAVAARGRHRLVLPARSGDLDGCHSGCTERTCDSDRCLDRGSALRQHER